MDGELGPRRFRYLGPGSVFVVAVVLLILRRPELLLRPQFVWEEATWYAVTFVTGPLASLAEPWAGFFYLVPRAAFLAARLVPPEVAPSMTGAVLILVVGGVAASLANERLVAIRSPVSRFVLGCSVALLPGASGPYLSVLNVGWILSVPLALIAVAREPSTRTGKAAECVVIVAAALTGPASIVLAPLYAATARSSYRLIRAGIVFIGAALQLLTFVASTRRPVEGLEITDVPPVLLVRLATSLLGDFASSSWFAQIPGLLLALGVVTLVTVILLLRSIRPPAVLALLYLGLAFATLGFVATGGELDQPGNGSRYFLVAAVAMVALALAGLENGRRAGLVIVGMFVIGLVVDFRMPSYPDTDWPAHARCIGSPLPCIVPVEPAPWSVHWLGPDGFVAPSGYDRRGLPSYE